MKYLIILFLLFGCGEQFKSEKQTQTDSTGKTYITITIDGCEYIVTESSTKDGWIVTCLTHKGNCKNSFHK